MREIKGRREGGREREGGRGRERERERECLCSVYQLINIDTYANKSRVYLFNDYVCFVYSRSFKYISPC